MGTGSSSQTYSVPVQKMHVSCILHLLTLLKQIPPPHSYAHRNCARVQLDYCSLPTYIGVCFEFANTLVTSFLHGRHTRDCGDTWRENTYARASSLFGSAGDDNWWWWQLHSWQDGITVSFSLENTYARASSLFGSAGDDNWWWWQLHSWQDGITVSLSNNGCPLHLL